MRRGSLRNDRLRARALLFAACVCVVRPLRAGDVPIVLQWNVPEGAQCPTQAEVAAEVSQLVASSPSSQHAFVRARADVLRMGNERFRVALTTELEGRVGHRTIEERSCKAMAEATVLILAWMIDPSAVASAQPNEGDDPPGVRVDPPRQHAMPTAPSTTREAPAPSGDSQLTGWQPVFGLETLADVGMLPSLALGAALVAGVRFDRLQLTARGALFNPVEARIADSDPALGASFSLSSARVEICGSPMRAAAAWGVAACAGPELDRLAAEGFGVDRPRSATVTWLSVALGAEGRARLTGPLELGGSLGVLLPLRRERFGLDGIGTLHRAAAASGRAALAIRLVF